MGLSGLIFASPNDRMLWQGDEGLSVFYFLFVARIDLSYYSVLMFEILFLPTLVHAVVYDANDLQDLESKSCNLFTFLFESPPF